jgi:molecular chaperone Hsp33
MSTPDLLVRAIAKGDDLRIVAAVTTEAVREAVRRHELSGAASAVIGRAITSGLLLATMTKGEERVTLQWVGDGPLRSVTSDANAAGEVRAYVARPDAEAEAERGPGRPRLGESLGKHGVLTVVRDLGMRELYQGQVSLVSGEVDEDVERYLRDSEQVPSALSCEVVLDAGGAVRRAGGILVQALPGGTSDAVTRANQRFQEGALYALLTGDEIGARALAERLSPSHPIEFLADRAVRFQCRCSAERIRSALRMLTRRDLDEMIEEAQPATVTCNFCNTTHIVELEELARIRDQLPTSASN